MQRENPVYEAIKILGRVEVMAVLCNVSSTSVWNWVKRGRVFDARHAVLIAAECARRGHPKMTVARLAGLEEDESGKSLGPSISRKPAQEAAA